MKRLYLVGGPMGVGKSAACRQLKLLLPNCAYLDGDWCWDMHPFLVTDETRAMVMDNIAHVLTGFLRCSTVQNVILSWVMHEQAILDDLLSRLPLRGCKVVSVSLVATPDVLTARLRGDIIAGLRSEDVIARSLERLPMYEHVSSVKLDTSRMSARQVAEAIARMG